MAAVPRLPSYSRWSETCDTLHAHTQLLGKLAANLAPPEPQLQHAALRLSARGWETLPLPVVSGKGAIVLALDLRHHCALVETSDGGAANVPLGPNRAVGEVTREVLAAVEKLAGRVEVDLAPQEVPWSVALDQDEEHATYDMQQASAYFAAATEAAKALAAFRAPYRGRSTPVNAWWGSFDLAVSLFSGKPADPPSSDFIMRNAMDAEEVAIGWWPGDSRYDQAAFYAYAHPAPDGFTDAALEPVGAYWHAELGEHLLDWSVVCDSANPHHTAVQFMRSAFSHACTLCGWDEALAGSADGVPPPVA